MAVATKKARTSTKQAPKTEPQTESLTEQAPEAEPQTQSLTQSQRDRMYAPHTSKVWVNYIQPIGSTKTGFSFPGRDAVKVFVDGEFKKFSNEAEWFDIWDSRDGSNLLGNGFKSVLEEHGSVMVKLYWERTSPAKDLLFVETINKRTGEEFKKLHFKNEPKRRVVAYDILKYGKNTPSKDAEVPETRPYGADCNNQEEIPF